MHPFAVKSPKIGILLVSQLQVRAVAEVAVQVVPVGWQGMTTQGSEKKLVINLLNIHTYSYL